MAKSQSDFDIWEDDSTKPESAWFDFKEIGDNVVGELMFEPTEKEGKFGIQKIYNIKDKDGKEWNVALKTTTHKMQIQQLRSANVGDIVAFKLRDLVDVGKVNPAKSIEVRIKHVNQG